MKIKFTLVIALISYLPLFGQSFEKLLHSKKNQPTYLINQKIIANYDVMKQFGSGQIVIAEVLKSVQKSTDQYADTYPNLSEYGLILIESTIKNIPAKSQNEIREFFGADAKTKIYVDGFLLMKDDFSIATKSIFEIEFIRPDEQNLNEEKIINIWTLAKDMRLGPLNIRKAQSAEVIDL